MVRTLTGKHPSYYEAVLQLREVSKKIHDFAFTEIHRAKIPITKTKKLKTGIDYYLADSNFAKALGKKLQQLYGGKVLTTASLFGVRKGKRVYRVTVLFRGVPFKKGQKVTYGGDTYSVKLMGKDILLQEVKTGKKVHVDYKEMRKIKATSLTH
jgi:nonsense-mediated mRNA decay protein 3